LVVGSNPTAGANNLHRQLKAIASAQTIPGAGPAEFYLNKMETVEAKSLPKNWTAGGELSEK
jgi:hypothetical protein